MKAPDDRQPLSDEAKNVDNRARDLISDLTKFDVRKRKPTRPTLWWFLLLAVALFLLFLLIINPGLSTNRSETPSVPSTTPGSASEDSGVAGEGPISGTWTMYRTDANGDEGYVATVRFLGADTGTVEMQDDGHSGGAFQMEDDQVSFEFTRTFDTSFGDWPERSRFTGTLTGPGEITGVWERQSWECKPSISKCEYHDEWARDPSRLVRKP